MRKAAPDQCVSNEAKVRPEITFVGALPPPVGGVTIFLHRLTKVLSSDMDITVLDLRNVEGKKPLSAGHQISPFRSRLLSLFWLQWKLFAMRPKVLHFHFSDTLGLILSVFLRTGNARTALTLHHGVTSLPRSRERLLRLFAATIRSRIDVMHVLNSDQKKLFSELVGFDADAIFLCPTHVSAKEGGTPASKEVVDLISRYERFILTSGVGNRLNRADLILDYWAKRPSDDIQLVVSVYGDTDSTYLAELQGKAESIPTAILIGPMAELDFNALLGAAELYVRPAEVDSFGIVVTDALTFGTPVLASDVCDRPKEAMLFDISDPTELAAKLDALLASPEIEAAISPISDRSDDYRDLYYSLAGTA